MGVCQRWKWFKPLQNPQHSAFHNWFSFTFFSHTLTSSIAGSTTGGALLQVTTHWEAMPQLPASNPLSPTEKEPWHAFHGYSRLSFDALVSSYVVGRDVALELAARRDWPWWQEEPSIPPALVGCIQHFKLFPSLKAQVLLCTSLIAEECHKVANVHQMLARQWR